MADLISKLPIPEKRIITHQQYKQGWVETTFNNHGNPIYKRRDYIVLRSFEEKGETLYEVRNPEYILAKEAQSKPIEPRKYETKPIEVEAFQFTKELCLEGSEKRYPTWAKCNLKFKYGTLRFVTTSIYSDGGICWPVKKAIG